jgi:hypothetical protein
LALSPPAASRWRRRDTLRRVLGHIRRRDQSLPGAAGVPVARSHRSTQLPPKPTFLKRRLGPDDGSRSSGSTPASGPASVASPASGPPASMEPASIAVGPASTTDAPGPERTSHHHGPQAWLLVQALPIGIPPCGSQWPAPQVLSLAHWTTQTSHPLLSVMQQLLLAVHGCPSLQQP